MDATLQQKRHRLFIILSATVFSLAAITSGVISCFEMTVSLFLLPQKRHRGLSRSV